ncbi:hypothetical protein L207DRAFT_584929 [Hyaloscypha variabilis F]|uniref:Asp/Glu racemase n=1 Tax=Hyaloscypha variabilis (strain UAMH 11265 / GT02V1 / F) TaxID=1149755 RepID=A0A2J6RHK7_HYAVF|nr:hypothetical protein L207DRAFT_584929 [Hyaloscypha variabilis F]
MVGHLANRAQFGLILPSTNTSVEAEFNRMLVPGVSWHSGRIFSANPDLSSNQAMEAFLVELRSQMKLAVESVCHAKIDYLLSGGLGITTGAAACGAVIDVYKAKKIGIITPYQPVGDQQVVDFFTQIGCEVKAIYGFKCPTATSIAEVTEEEIKRTFRSVDGEDVDLLIQAGTNLLAGKAAAELEVELGKPVIAINTATVWHAYRTNGIKDQISGWGSLLEKH